MKVISTAGLSKKIIHTIFCFVVASVSCVGRRLCFALTVRPEFQTAVLRKTHQESFRRSSSSRSQQQRSLFSYSVSSSLLQEEDPSSSEDDNDRDYTEQDLQRWEQMYEQQHSQSGMPPSPSSSSEIRLITLDLDNTLWNTTATIEAANEALARHMNQHLPNNNTLRVEHVMGQLFRNDKARYCPIEKDDAKSPVLLTQLRKDAIRYVLEQHSSSSNSSTDGEEEVTDIEVFVDEAFDVWTKARHAAIPQHLAVNVASCLQQIRSLRTLDSDTPVVVGAVTDGNSDPLSIPKLGEYFDFCVNAEMVGVSKPDKRVYLRAVARAMQHPSLSDLLPVSESSSSSSSSSVVVVETDGTVLIDDDDALEDLIGPWWVHIGDDFQKDIVASKNLNMRTVWTRELILNKIKTPTTPKVKALSSSRTVEELDRKLSEMKVIEMQLGAEDYLADSLQKEFADATTDEFHSIASILQGWHSSAAISTKRKTGNDEATLEAEEGSSAFFEAVRPDRVPPSNDSRNNVPKETKFCIHCGAKLPSLAKFCSACGEQQQ